MATAQDYYDAQANWKEKQKYHNTHGFPRLQPQDKIAIVKAYKNLEPMMSIAIRYHKSRTTIYKVLKKAGADTSKHKISVSCSTCGNIIYRDKSRIRKIKNHFCNMICYQAFLDASHLTPTEQRRGNKRSRKIVSQYFNLLPNYIVHHDDKNALNNQVWNLRVFKTQGDHIRHHRGFDVEPIWNGANL